MDRAAIAALKTEPALVDAFAAFTAAAGRLEGSYQQLQGEVIRLREELEQRNAALTASLAENQQMRAALSRIFEAMPSGVIVLNASGQVSFKNPEAERLLGNDVAGLLPRINCIANNEQELCLESGDRKRWLVVRTAQLPSDKTQLVLILRDVTSQREMEQEREEARRLIALAEMSTVLAHEIRNPLGSMELLTGLLMTAGEFGPEQRTWVEHLQAGVRSLSATVNNVLRVHTLGASTLKPLEIAAVLRSAARFIAPLADQASIKVLTDIELGGAKVNGNAAELQQVILNLALNAFRHTPANGQVRVRGRLEQNQAAIEFSDTGSGIPTEQLSKIFETGFTTQSDSPGLGLAVCRKIVQQHGGTIAARSENGAIFRMEFPVL
jgi:two-component system sensor histidine kinase FlrB